jgi:stage V sporulation protein AE
MNLLQSIDLIGLLKCFITGGVICVIGQILIDKTKLTPARILVAFVTTGAILGGLGIYKYLVDFAGAGATVPLTGFGYNLAKGTIKGVHENGIIRSIYWWAYSVCWRYCSCYFLWIYCIFNFKA